MSLALILVYATALYAPVAMRLMNLLAQKLSSSSLLPYWLDHLVCFFSIVEDIESKQ